MDWSHLSRSSCQGVMIDIHGVRLLATKAQVIKIPERLVELSQVMVHRQWPHRSHFQYVCMHVKYSLAHLHYYVFMYQPILDAYTKKGHLQYWALQA